MNKRITQIGISVLSILVCVVVAFQGQSRFSISQTFGQASNVWHHYNKKTPTISEKGIREYWIQCGGSYQFFAPASGTIIDKGSNYDTSEFTVDDDRWLTYCDEYGHNEGEHGICSTCGKLASDLVSASAIDGASSYDTPAPKGFNNVHRFVGLSRGSYVGVNINISEYHYVYFALMETSINTLYVYGGNSTYASISQYTWTYFLLVQDKTTTKFSVYTRNGLNDSWSQKTLDDSDQSATSFNRLRFYNWDSTTYTVCCTEVYAAEFNEEDCNHTFDEHGVCTLCNKLKDSFKVANYPIAGSSSYNSMIPTGFTSTSVVTGKSNGQLGVSLDISNFTSLYFGLYTENGSARPFSGGDDGDGSHRIVWSGRWYFLLVEKIDGKWNGFIKEGPSGEWYTRTVDGNTDTNFSSLLRLYNWDGLEGVTIYSTEVYAAEYSDAPVEKADSINIGVWNGSYHFQNTSSIDDLVSAGMKVVVGVNPVWHSNWTSILNYALSKGVKFIVDPRQWDYDNGCYLDWDGTCPSYANHDAVLGFIMWDEPNTTKYSQIAQLKAQFESVMPAGKLFFVNLLSGAAGMTSLYGGESGHKSTYDYYETNYAYAYQNTVSPDLYSFDSYPLFNNGEIRKSYFCTFDVWSNISKIYDIPAWYTLLSSSHLSGDGAGYTYLLPNKEQLKWQMSVALSFGMTNLLHYIYASGASDYSCMANVDGTKNEYFDVVSSANSEILALDDDLSDYGWEGALTYHNNSKVNLLFKDLKHTISASQAGINQINATSDLLIGSYIDNSDNRAYMVTNSGISTDYSYTWSTKYRDYNANVAYSNTANSVSIKFEKNISGAYVIQNGTKRYVSASNNTIAIDLVAYGSAFVIPD